MILDRKFFERNSVDVAKELIGCHLVRKSKSGKIERYKIVETESYEGGKDKASHAARGITERNKVMFGDAAVWYVYFTYGMHHMLNIVCGKSSHPAAVLIRGVEGCIGPGRLTKKLGIDLSFNRKQAIPKTKLWIESKDEAGLKNINNKRSSGKSIRSGKKLKIHKTPRIGVDSAGPVWSKKLYRFVLEGYE